MIVVWGREMFVVLMHSLMLFVGLLLYLQYSFVVPWLFVIVVPIVIVLIVIRYRMANRSPLSGASLFRTNLLAIMGYALLFFFLLVFNWIGDMGDDESIFYALWYTALSITMIHFSGPLGESYAHIFRTDK